MWDERAVADFAETLRQTVTGPAAPDVAGRVAGEVTAALLRAGVVAAARTGPPAGTPRAELEPGRAAAAYAQYERLKAGRYGQAPPRELLWDAAAPDAESCRWW